MEEIKKRKLADIDAVEPRKRGRPAKGNKIPKPPPSGRGRGRPAKKIPIPSTVKNTKRRSVSVSDEEDESNVIENGDDDVEPMTAVVAKGRAPKRGKLKVLHPIEATGKGRGRPKNPIKSAETDEEIEENDESEDEDDENAAKPKEKEKAKKPVKGKSKALKPGRPRKVANSDDDESGSDDKDVERRPVGRPQTGAVNLNIERTGRGPGRPKQKKVDARAVPATKNATKSRGRPPTAKSPSSAKSPSQLQSKPKTQNSTTITTTSNVSNNDDDEEGDDNSDEMKDVLYLSKDEDNDAASSDGQDIPSFI